MFPHSLVSLGKETALPARVWQQSPQPGAFDAMAPGRPGRRTGQCEADSRAAAARQTPGVAAMACLSHPAQALSRQAGCLVVLRDDAMPPSELAVSGQGSGAQTQASQHSSEHPTCLGFPKLVLSLR